MKVLKNAGSFKILTPQEELKKQFLRIERAGRTCYQSYFGRKITEKTAAEFVSMLIKRGHESVLEHSLLTVLFINISRGFTHEMVRHRLCAFSQESTRYVDYAKKGEDVDLERFEIKCIVPPHQDENKKVQLPDGREMSIKEMFGEYEKFYRALRKAGWLPEDARQVLPIGLKSEIVVSANFREWRHIFELRTSRYAHWEIRSVMSKLLLKLKSIVPAIFQDFVQAGVDKNGVPFFEKKL